MKTIRCTLTLKDGQVLTAIAKAKTPDEDVQVNYSGAVRELGLNCRKGSLPFLVWFLEARAVQLGAKMAVETHGEYQSPEQ